MDRRTFLAAGAGVASLLAGCTGDGGESPPPESTPTATATGTPTPPYWEGVDLPEGVYVQPFEGEMLLGETTTAGPYGVALMYAAPHRFWLPEGDDAGERPVRPADDLHLMATVWDRETGRVVPETGLSVAVRRGDDVVSEEVIYPMLSQGMGFHYGGNFILDGDGDYAVDVTVGGLPVRASGAFEGRFADPVTATLGFSFTAADRESLDPELRDDYGDPGAVRPAAMDGVPSPLSAAAVPGDSLGSAMADDAEVVPTLLEGGEAPVGDRYLAVYLRTRYNGLALPAAGLSATVTRNGGTVADTDLRRTLDPAAGYHYGAELASDLRAGDEVTVETVVPPQVARHEGYERAFLRMDPVTVAVD